MLNIFKVLTKSGRQELVREAAVQIITRENISALAAQGVNALLQKACAGIDDAKMQAICGYCTEGADLFSVVSKAAADKVISTEEAKDICARVQNLTGLVITQETLDGIIDRIVSKVP